jgi:cysteine desulfurase
MKLWSKRIYADAAAATPLSKSVARELARVSALFGNPSALHKEAVAAKKELEGARESVARTLGAHADEIIFTGSGTEANNLALFGALKGTLGAHAITTAIEHSSVLEPLRALERDGLELTILPADERGLIDPKALREAMKENTALVSVQMVNSEIGTIQNIREIAKEVRHARKERFQKNLSNGAGDALPNLPLLFHTDASQAPLWLPLNVERLGVDLLTIDAQKMLGPKGAGALFARRGVALAPLIYGGRQEKGRRSGTENVAHAAALALALREAQAEAGARAADISDIRDFLISEIKKIIPRVRLNGAEGAARVANNVNISIKGLNGDMAVVALDARGVAASTRSACDTEGDAPSHVLKAIGRSPEEAKDSIRITLLPDATIGQATRILEALEAVTSRYRQGI